MSRTIQIRRVPDEVHAILRSHAAAAGLSLSEYLLRVIDEVASRPAVADELRQAGATYVVIPAIRAEAEEADKR